MTTDDKKRCTVCVVIDGGKVGLSISNEGASGEEIVLWERCYAEQVANELLDACGELEFQQIKELSRQ